PIAAEPQPNPLAQPRFLPLNGGSTPALPSVVLPSYARFSHPLRWCCPRGPVRLRPPLLLRHVTPPLPSPRPAELSVGPAHPLQGLRRPQPGGLRPPGSSLLAPGPATGPRDPLPQLGVTPQRRHRPGHRRA